MMAWLRRLFSARTPPQPENFYQRLHDATVNARAQTRASQRATQRIHAQASRDFSETLRVPPVWRREGGQP